MTSWDSSGQPGEIQQTEGSGSSAITTSLLYTYLTSGVNTGLLSTVTKRQKIGTGSWQTVQSLEYSYYGSSSANGQAGNLQSVVEKDDGGTTTDSTYYRYYTSGSSAGLMKYAFGADAYARLTAALGTSVDGLSDSAIAPYADKYLAYDTSGRVTTSVDAASGCSACSGGLGSFSYSYYSNSSATLTDPNFWTNRTTETLPDGNENIVYTNSLGQTILSVYKDTTTNQKWATYTRYDTAGHVVLVAQPSALTGYSESYSDLVYYGGGGSSYLSTGSGLISTSVYATATTATTSSAGDVEGWLKETFIQQGTGGSTIKQSSQTYIQSPGGTYVPAASTVYRNYDGTGAQTTTTSYTWQGSTAQPASITTTLPTVTTAQNGSNSATSATTVFDSFGRPIWSMDADGFLAYTEYDDATGAVVKTIQDVNSSGSGFSNKPTGWTTPSGGGLHLVTSYEVDSQGAPPRSRTRTAKSTTPSTTMRTTRFASTRAGTARRTRRPDRPWSAGTTGPGTTPNRSPCRRCRTCRAVGRPAPRASAKSSRSPAATATPPGKPSIRTPTSISRGSRTRLPLRSARRA